LDSTKYSLADFAVMKEKTLQEKVQLFQEFMDDIKNRKHLNYKRISCSGSGPTMTIIDPYTNKKRDMIYLASNDYLNLTRHPKTIKAGEEALKKYGTGAGSVPLLGGTLDIHVELEKRIASFKGCESALLYSNGFGSNAGSIAALLQEGDIAILDMFVHASIIDGCKKTEKTFFRHNDMKSLEKVLARVKDKYRTKLVIVDGVYSMDGDIAKLDEICTLAHNYDALVMVDEAHATGVIGENGRGTVEYYNLEGQVDIVAGTFSKALGVVGGFIASSKEIINYLNYYSRTYMFSTAPTPQATGSLLAALEVIEEEKELRDRLWDNINYLRSNLLDLGFNLGHSETAIFPIVIGNDLIVREMCRELHDEGLYVNPVPYPAVPKRLSRIRISITQGHTRDQLNKTLNVMEGLGKKYQII
jgi:glycine C-acetyltransferase